MNKARWRPCDKPDDVTREDFIQVYEFKYIPQHQDHVKEIRVFFDLGEEELYRVRKMLNGQENWFKTNPHTDVDRNVPE